MLFLLIDLGVLLPAGAISWWLSGYDDKLIGDNSREDLIRRGIRCTLSLIIIGIGFRGLWGYWQHGDRAAAMLFIATLLPIAFLWKGCLTEVAARLFLGLVDPQDQRPYDPDKGLRELDAVGELIRSGRKDEAIQLCRTLLEASDENRAALELALHQLGAQVETAKESTPLAEAGRLRREGQFTEAETMLVSLLAAQPANTEAALMLMRVYAQDLRREDKAFEVLRALEKQKYVSRAYIEFARRSIGEWKKPKVKEAVPEPVPESIEELLEKKYFGTAIEALEKQAEDEPNNFDVWLKLAEVHGRYCANFHLAEKMLRKIQINPAFTEEQVQLARSKVREWTAAAQK